MMKENYPPDIHTHQPVFKGFEIASLPSSKWSGIPKKSIDEMCFYSVGIHPMEIRGEETNVLEKLKILLQFNQVIAIGECGLDKRVRANLMLQQSIFRKHVEFARNFQKPLIIHCVGYWNELEAFFKERKMTDPAWIIHGFRKQKLTEKFLRLGAYLSFGEALLYDSATQSCVIKTPVERLFLETDDATVKIIALYEKVAELKCLSLQALIDRVNENVDTVFFNGQLAGKNRTDSR